MLPLLAAGLAAAPALDAATPGAIAAAATVLLVEAARWVQRRGWFWSSSANSSDRVHAQKLLESNIASLLAMQRTQAKDLERLEKAQARQQAQLDRLGPQIDKLEQDMGRLLDLVSGGRERADG